MYRVGFGDSFLVSFDYRRALGDGRRHRHILIDCGTTRRDRQGPPLNEVAKLITEHCEGKLDVLVVTHRHADHLSAFNDEVTGAVLDSLAPSLVLRPWTDNPAAPIDATGPVPLDDASRRYVSNLRAGQEAAEVIATAVKQADIRSLVGELGGLARYQIRNQAAIDRLERYARDGTVAYLAFGDDTGISNFVPGIAVEVLGPPTLAQWPALSNQRSDDPDEFWMLNRGLVDQGFTTSGIDPADPQRWALLLDEHGVGPARWLLEHLDSQRVASLLRIVRTFDDALNNTSLILLLKVGDRRLLFSGDAQIENWSYILKAPGVPADRRHELDHIDLYKVGHHGSRNATPRSLFKLWNTEEASNHPMVSIMSTLPGVHGRRASTAVPRATLVEALRRRTRLYSSDECADGETHVHLSAVTKGDAIFTLS